jgi:REP element-mobilizing transposase RayT
MVRKIRKDFPGAWHHVMHRGARREPIFLHDEHCLLFLELAESVVQKYEVEFHGYSLMPNHYHILARSRHGNLSDAMGFLNGRYTQRVNRLHRWDGPVFRGRFTSKLVRDETSLPYILAYIHLNPLRANLVTRIDSRCWTSMRAYLGRKGEPDWLVKKYFFELHGGSDALRAYTLSLHRGTQTWPDTMDLEWGFFTQESQEKVAAAQRQSSFKSRFIEPEHLFEMILQVTGMNRENIIKPVMGPRANPARRFAVWALREHSLLKHKEIAILMDMTQAQVSNVLSRFKAHNDPTLVKWAAKLERLYDK